MKTKLMRFVRWSVSIVVLAAPLTGCNESYGTKIVTADEGRLTVSDAQGKDYKTHEVATDATITLDGAPAKLEELNSGDAVSVKVEDREGLEVATEITASTDATPETTPSAAPSAANTPTEAGTMSDGSDKPNATTPPPGETSPVQLSLPAEQSLDVALPPATRPVPAATEPNDQTEIPSDDSVHGKIASMGDNQLTVKDESGADQMVTVNANTKYMLDGEAASFADLAMDQMVTAIGQMEGDKFVAKSVAATTK